MWRRAPARECTRFVTRMTRVWRGSAGISRSVAMKLTGHKTEAVYRRYAIVAESDLREAGTKLAATLETSPATASLGDNSGDNSVTARKERSLSG